MGVRLVYMKKKHIGGSASFLGEWGEGDQSHYEMLIFKLVFFKYIEVQSVFLKGGGKPLV